MANEVTKKDIDAINKRIDAVEKSIEATQTWAKKQLDTLVKELTATDAAVNQHAKAIDDLQKG